MNKSRYKDLCKTMCIQTTSYKTEQMTAFILNELSQIEGVTVVNDKQNIYVTKGEAESYPCIVAHTDTVHDLVNNFLLFNSGDRLFSIDGDTMERVGIGGDDKVGVFVALQILKEVDVCKAAFFRDEEVGCVGSADADMSFFKDVEFALQCDRKGYKDFVNEIYGTKLFSSEFSHGISAILDKWSRAETSGGLTDVCQLVTNGLGVCVANMSCGYYDPHSDNEFIVISEVDETLEFVLEIFEAMAGQMWLVPDEDRKVARTPYGGYSGYSGRTGHSSYWDWDWNPGRVTPLSSIETTEEDDVPVSLDYCVHCSSREVLLDELTEKNYCFNCDSYGPATVDDAVDFYDDMGLDLDDDDPKSEQEESLDRLSSAAEDLDMTIEEYVELSLERLRNQKSA